MKVVRDREDARWLPSRHHFALFRLIAFLRLRAAQPRPRPGLVLVVDRHQSALENHTVSIWIMLTLAGYLAAGLLARWPLPLAVPAAVFLAATFANALNIAGGVLFLVRSSPNNIRPNSILFMTTMLLLAVYFARHASWARFVAWQFLALVALNAVAAAIVFLLRDPIARLEAAFAA